MTDIQCTAQTLAHTRRCLVALPALPACSACQGSTGPRQRVALANHRLVFGFSQLSPLRRSLRDTCGWSTISTPSLFLTGRRGGRITTTSVHPLFTNDRPRPSLFENLSEPSFNDFSRPKPRMVAVARIRLTPRFFLIRYLNAHRPFRGPSAPSPHLSPRGPSPTYPDEYLCIRRIERFPWHLFSRNCTRAMAAMRPRRYPSRPIFPVSSLP